MNKLFGHTVHMVGFLTKCFFHCFIVSLFRCFIVRAHRDHFQGAGGGASAAVTDKKSPSSPPPSPSGDGFQDAGATMMGGPGGGGMPIPEVKMAKRGAC